MELSVDSNSYTKTALKRFQQFTQGLMIASIDCLKNCMYVFLQNLFLHKTFLAEILWFIHIIFAGNLFNNWIVNWKGGALQIKRLHLNSVSNFLVLRNRLRRANYFIVSRKISVAKSFFRKEILHSNFHFSLVWHFFPILFHLKICPLKCRRRL